MFLNLLVNKVFYFARVKIISIVFERRTRGPRPRHFPKKYLSIIVLTWMLPLFSIDTLFSHAAPRRESLMRFERFTETDVTGIQINDIFCDVLLKPLPFEIFHSINVPILIDEDADNNLLFITSLIVFADDKSNEIRALLNDALKSTNTLIQMTNKHSSDHYNKMIDAPYLELNQFIPTTLLKDDNFMQKLLLDTIAETRQLHLNDFDYHVTFKQNIGSSCNRNDDYNGNDNDNDNNGHENNNKNKTGEYINNCKLASDYSDLRVHDYNIQSFKYYCDSAINDEQGIVLYPRLDDDIVRYQYSCSSLNSLCRSKIIPSSMVSLKSLRCNAVDIDSTVFIQNVSSTNNINSNKKNVLYDFNCMGKISEKTYWKDLVYKDELKDDQFFHSDIPKLMYPGDLKIDQSLHNLKSQVELKLSTDVVLSNYLRPDSFTSQYIMSSWDSNLNKSKAKVVTKIKSEKSNLLKDISSCASRIKMLTGANVSTDCLFFEDVTLKYSLLSTSRYRAAGKIYL